MKPVMQQRIGPTGDCFSACLASILELPLSEVPCFFVGNGEPHPVEDQPRVWWGRVRQWLRERGLGIVTIAYDGTWDWADVGVEGYQLVTVTTDRGFDHSQVWHNGHLVHDPHPAAHLSTVKAVTNMDILYSLTPEAL